jgi:thymidylate synthase
MKQYLDTLSHIIENGTDKDDRTGTGTRSVFGHQIKFDLNDGFPAVTTKRLAWKSVVSELLWFLEGSTDERRLAEILYDKPRSELTDKTTIWTANADAQGVALGYTNSDARKELGPVYGAQWRNWGGVDQIANIVHSLKTNPNDRRMILSAWNVGEVSQMALPPCHMLYQFNVTNGKLNCMLTCRSQDVFLGTPFNIASASLLTHMLAQVCDLKVGEYTHSSGDTHIYSNHFEQVNEQLTRSPLPLPSLWLNPDIKNIDDFTMDDIKLVDYQCHDNIKAPMAV